MATTTSITTSYAGEFAGEYIAAALLSGVTLSQGGVSIKPNIKFKEVVKKETVFVEVGEEKTIFRFLTDAEANVVGTNELQAKLVNSIQ